MIIDRYGEAAGAALSAIAGERYIERLERAVEARVGKKCVALCSFDAALHTALYLCGVERGDYVFVPSFTFYSYIMPVEHVGGVPVFLDCDPVTRCVSEPALDTALLWSVLQNKPPKAVVVDNAFGSVADYDVLLPLCSAYGVPMIELAADAFFGEYNGKPCGANGNYGVVGWDKSALGGGAALVCGDDKQKAEEFARVAYSDGENFDYKMDNVIAALASARIKTDAAIAKRGKANLAALAAAAENTARFVAGDAGKYALVKTAFADELRADGYTVKKPPPVHTLTRYGDCRYFEHEIGYSVCESFNEYCLISMDISMTRLKRLIKRIRNA